jgi:hypothetical protein
VRKAKFTTRASSRQHVQRRRPHLHELQGTDPTVAPDTDVAHARAAPNTLDPVDAAVVEAYTPGPPGTPPPTPAEIEAICASYSGSQINRAALQYNCQQLSQYNLFANPTDPRSGANEGGTRFELTTQLFSDYAKKYRFVFLPPGQQAVWHEGSSARAERDARLPGRHGDREDVRVPERRERGGGRDAPPDPPREDGRRLVLGGHGVHLGQGRLRQRTDAHLAIAGGTASVAWNYEDPDPDVNATYAGSTNRYLIPQANQCGQLPHQRRQGSGRLADRPQGAAAQPADGLRQRRREPAPALGRRGHAQRRARAHVDGEHVATNVQRIPRFNVPGDAANIPASEPGRLAQMSRARSTRSCARAASSRPTARTATTATASPRARACSSTCSAT